MYLIRFLVVVAALATMPARAEDQVATYVEYNGKVIELVDAISPLYEGMGKVIHTAFEADDLVTPANLDKMYDSLQLIGWRRDGETLTIYFDRKRTVQLPASAMKARIVDRLSDDECCASFRRYPGSSRPSSKS